MKIIIESPFTIDEASDQQIREKLHSLEEFKMNITQVFLYFKIDDGEANKVANCEIEIHLPGPVIFASDANKDFMKSFHSAFGNIRFASFSV